MHGHIMCNIFVCCIGTGKADPGSSSSLPKWHRVSGAPQEASCCTTPGAGGYEAQSWVSISAQILEICFLTLNFSF